MHLINRYTGQSGNSSFGRQLLHRWALMQENTPARNDRAAPCYSTSDLMVSKPCMDCTAGMEGGLQALGMLSALA